MGRHPGSVGSRGEEWGGAAVVTVTVTWLLSSRPRQGECAPHSQQRSLVIAWWHWMWSWLCGSASPTVPEFRFWQQLLSQACPVACQALLPAPASIQGARILQTRAVLERKWTRSWHSGCSLSDWEPRGRGAPELASTGCQLFPAPSGSPQHLQGSLAVESSACSHSLPRWRWDWWWAHGWWRALPWH